MCRLLPQAVVLFWTDYIIPISKPTTILPPVFLVPAKRLNRGIRLMRFRKILSCMAPKLATWDSIIFIKDNFIELTQSSVAVWLNRLQQLSRGHCLQNDRKARGVVRPRCSSLRQY